MDAYTGVNHRSNGLPVVVWLHSPDRRGQLVGSEMDQSLRKFNCLDAHLT